MLSNNSECKHNESMFLYSIKLYNNTDMIKTIFSTSAQNLTNYKFDYNREDALNGDM
jgi:hypothetical protein